MIKLTVDDDYDKDLIRESMRNISSVVNTLEEEQRILKERLPIELTGTEQSKDCPILDKAKAVKEVLSELFSQVL